MTKEKKIIKLKKILPFLDMTAPCSIYQGDVYIENHVLEDWEDKWEEIFKGSIMNIPWALRNYYLVNTIDDNSISIRSVEGKPYIVISVFEDKERAMRDEEII